MKAAVALLLLVVAGSAYSGGFSGSRDINRLEVLDNNTFMIDSLPGQPFQNPDGCGDPARIAVVTADPALANRQLTVILSALNSGKPIEAFVNGCYLTPWGAVHPKLQNLMIYRN